MKKIPIGIYDFEKIISEDYYYIDKTLFIKELLDSGAEATLVPRPRRFGKTLNMTMLKCFFEGSKEPKKYLFNDLKIAQYLDCMKHQGQYPVIYLSLKDAKSSGWEDCFQILISCIGAEFRRHNYLLESDQLSPQEKEWFVSILEARASVVDYLRSLLELSRFLSLFHRRKPIILIDEYDSPIHAGFVNNYYDQVIEFMRGFLSAGLKDNPALQFSVLTGILRVAKESIFSGLNNLRVCTLLDDHFVDKFGLLEGEVRTLLQDYNLEISAEEVARWYDGYTVGKQKGIYNPWSIINLVDNRGVVKPYWINTAAPKMIKELIIRANPLIAQDIEYLIQGKSIERRLQEDVIFDDLYSNDEIIWTFLVLSGYLSFSETRLEKSHRYALLRLPNMEVVSFYETIILSWLKKDLHFKNYQAMLHDLTSGKVDSFEQIFQDMVIESLSTFDVTDNEPERFYHALVLGMLVSLNDSYEVLSNRESGYGRYDVTLTPRDKSDNKLYGIIIEFKRIKKHEKKILKIAAQEALDQIEEMAYETQMRNAGVTRIIKLAIAFKGKKTLVMQG